jgi:hypothetical protein
MKNSNVILAFILGGALVVAYGALLASTGWVGEISRFSRDQSLAYQSTDLGIEFRYPRDWTVQRHGSNLSIYNPGAQWPSQESTGLSIEWTSTTIEAFINKYEQSDQSEGRSLARIRSRDELMVDGVHATSLVGTTAIGIDQTFLFIPRRNGALVVSYVAGNPYHDMIVSSVNLQDTMR